MDNSKKSLAKILNNGTYISVLVDMISAIKENKVEKMFNSFNRFMELTEEKELDFFNYDDERRRQLTSIRNQLIELRSKLEEAKTNKTKVIIGQELINKLEKTYRFFKNLIIY